jgi:hypothetical protein
MVSVIMTRFIPMSTTMITILFFGVTVFIWDIIGGRRPRLIT